MLILAFETASYKEASVAVWNSEGGFRVKTFPMGRDLSSQLVPEVGSMLGKEVPDLIVVDRGPGSFTGIRTGLAAAQGLALGWGAKLVGISRLDFYPRDTEDENELLLLDARAGGGFYYEYRTNGKKEAGFCKKDELSLKFPDCQCYYGECDETTFPGKRFVRLTGEPDAKFLIALAMEKMESGEELPADAIYLHLRAVLPKNKI
ncbi:tRNA (adenosine(37)-N6)-threonylcarbamoyltransferase complex dimerization subunit type 1 TsaB [bacterium]|nr:tRNA (adenosine(37)-N6)-threonylcarbamoyltransferase complex dimerization subunit type 1 TsaB [bacterium]